MQSEIIHSIKSHIDQCGIDIPFPTTTVQKVASAEASIGMPLPLLLRELLIDVGNGGFGPGYGIIGVDVGYHSDLSDIAGTYQQVCEGWSECGDTWPTGVLPFCEFGSNIFACDTNDTSGDVLISTDSTIVPTTYDLERFFQTWIKGADILAVLPRPPRPDIINPFLNRPDN